MNEKLRILIVEDSEDDALIIVNEIMEGGFDPEYERVETEEGFSEALTKGGWDLVISDHNLPCFSGLNALNLFKASGLDLPFIMVSGVAGEEAAVDSMLAGAHDFIVKGKWARLIPAIKRELKDAENQRERKRAEDELMESQEKFKSLTENLDGVVYRASISGLETTFVSQNVRKFFGYTREEWLGDPKLWEKSIFPEDRDMVMEKVEQAKKEGKSITLEYRLIRKDGTIMWVRDHTSFEKNPQGRLVSANGVVYDISSQKEAKETLMKNIALLDTIKKSQSCFITESNPMVMFSNVLDNIVQLTQSEFGFIAETLYEANGTPYIKDLAITNVAWDKASAEMFTIAAATGLEFRNMNTLFGAVVTSGKPVISNDPSNDPRSGGVPKGHPSLSSFAGFPLYKGEKQVGIYCLANRSGGYNEEIMEYLQPFSEMLANMIKGFRESRELEQTRKSLKKRLLERELLLREIHHRVKNNLHLVSGLFFFESERTNDPVIKRILRNCQNRIDIMALIHEKLYQSENFSIINFQEYLESFTSFLSDFYKEKMSAQFKIDAEKVFLEVGTAIPCGLVINELVSNALKYAFPHKGKGEIAISFREISPSGEDEKNLKNKMFELIVKDNGVGLPKELDIHNTGSLGFYLVKGLVEKQLQGSIEYDPSEGAEFRIRFRTKKKTSREDFK